MTKKEENYRKLLKNGYKGKVVGTDFVGTCPNGHPIKMGIYYYKKSVYGCSSCYYKARKGKATRKPNIVSPGDKFGDNVVLEYLGIIKGHSRAKVLHGPTGKERIATVSALRSGKFSGWGKEGSNTVKKIRYGKKGIKPGTILKKKESRYTYRDLGDRIKDLSLRLSDKYTNKLQDSIEFAGTEKIEFICKCGLLSRTKFTNLFYGITRSCGCDKSKSQSDLFEYISSLCPDAVFNDRNTIYPYEIDIYIPSLMLGIEYCGLYWHGEKLLSKKQGQAKARKYHYEKMLKCKKKGVRLVTIFSDEWLEKETIVKQRLLSIFKKNITIAGARKCTIKEINSSDARNFLKATHLQGACKSSIYIGAFYNDQLCSVMSFSKPNASRRTVGAYDFELVRFSVSGGHYPGLASKMLKFFLRKYSSDNIVSYSDNRWSEGNLYEALGFTCKKESTSSYWYFKDHGWSKKYHRYSFRKSVAISKFGGTKEQTEWKIMSDNGYDRIWDCGSKTWVLELKRG